MQEQSIDRVSSYTVAATQLPILKNTQIQIHKYTNINTNTNTNTNTQIHKYTNTQIHKYKCRSKAHRQSFKLHSGSNTASSFEEQLLARAQKLDQNMMMMMPMKKMMMIMMRRRWWWWWLGEEQVWPLERERLCSITTD